MRWNNVWGPVPIFWIFYNFLLDLIKTSELNFLNHILIGLREIKKTKSQISGTQLKLQYGCVFNILSSTEGQGGQSTQRTNGRGEQNKYVFNSDKLNEKEVYTHTHF